MTSLAPIADRHGKLAVLAMDQRGTLRRMLTEVGRPSTTTDLSEFKVDVVEMLSPAASGVLLDLELGVEPVRQAGVLADGVGVLLAAEPADKRKIDGEHHTVAEPGKDAGWVREHGCDALKFLVQWNPDRPTPTDGSLDLSAISLDVVGQIVRDCAAAGVPGVIEPLIAVAPRTSPSQADKEAMVVRSAVRMAALGMDLLKIEWPGGAAGCQAVTDQLGTVPWALLSAGVTYDQFVERTRVALDHGAVGFIAGRAIWGEAVGMDRSQRRAWLGSVARQRLTGLIEVLADHGRTWQEVRG